MDPSTEASLYGPGASRAAPYTAWDTIAATLQGLGTVREVNRQRAVEERTRSVEESTARYQREQDAYNRALQALQVLSQQDPGNPDIAREMMALLESAPKPPEIPAIEPEGFLGWRTGRVPVSSPSPGTAPPVSQGGPGDAAVATRPGDGAAPSPPAPQTPADIFRWAAGQLRTPRRGRTVGDRATSERAKAIVSEQGIDPATPWTQVDPRVQDMIIAANVKQQGQPFVSFYKWAAGTPFANVLIPNDAITGQPDQQMLAAVSANAREYSPEAQAQARQIQEVSFRQQLAGAILQGDNKALSDVKRRMTRTGLFSPQDVAFLTREARADVGQIQTNQPTATAVRIGGVSYPAGSITEGQRLTLEANQAQRDQDLAIRRAERAQDIAAETDRENRASKERIHETLLQAETQVSSIQRKVDLAESNVEKWRRIEADAHGRPSANVPGVGWFTEQEARANANQWETQIPQLRIDLAGAKGTVSRLQQEWNQLSRPRFEKLPNPRGYEGRMMRNPETGRVVMSTGTSWVDVEPEMVPAGATP